MVRGLLLILILSLLSTSLLLIFQLSGENNDIPITALLPLKEIKNKDNASFPWLHSLFDLSASNTQTNSTLSLKKIKNNVNSSFPLQLIKGKHPLSDFSSSKNSTLVVVWGDIRSSEQAWETLYQQVLDMHQADLALIVQRPPQNSSKPSLYARAKYVWEYHDFGDRWDQAIDLIGSSHDNNTTWREFAKKSYIALGGSIVMPQGSGAIIYTLRWFAMNCLEPLLPFYERFVFTRIDHLYFCADPPLGELERGSIWVPTGADWSGVSDRHVICDREDVMKVLNVLPPIVKHPAKNLDYTRSKSLNTETLLKYAWIRERIWDRVKRYPRNMAITAVSTDTSRWKKAKIPGVGAAHGLLMKYSYEYDIVKKTCNMSSG